IKKYQQSKVAHWAKVLEIPESKFLEDAINFYLRHLALKEQVNCFPALVPIQFEEVEDIENSELFTGGIEL
ncbi:MAG: hypothetical protein AAF349_25205, partial [Cyanobacteria bacterium P01_A01_bin.68]